MGHRRLLLTPKKCINLILYFCVLFSAAVSLFGVTHSIFYICDILNLILLYFVLRNVGRLRKSRESAVLFNVFIFLMLSLLVSAVINTVSPLLVLWGLRNLCRQFILFFGIILFYTMDDVKKIINFYFVIQILNFLIGLYKYFVLGLFSDDFGGGLFLNGGGLNPFCLLLLCYYSSMYFRKKTTLPKFLFVVGATFTLGAMAEEKMMIVLAVICMGMTIFINQYYENSITIRKIALGIGIVIGLVIVYNLVKSLAPDILKIVLDKETFMRYASVTFDEGYRIPRVGSFEVINKLFLHTSIERLFGLGIGNCDTSNFSFLQSEFYNRYGDYNYRWFTHQWTYLECGIIGFGIFVLFFVVIIFLLLKKCKKCNRELQPYLISSAIFTASMILLMWHSSAIRIDTGYIIYFGVAIGFVAMREQCDDTEMEKVV